MHHSLPKAVGYYADKNGDLQYDPIGQRCIDISHFKPKNAQPEGELMPSTRSGAVTRAGGVPVGESAPASPTGAEARRRRLDEALKKDPESLKVAAEAIGFHTSAPIPASEREEGAEGGKRRKRGMASKNKGGAVTTKQSYIAALQVSAHY